MIALRGILSTVKELFYFVWQGKRWWLLPVIVLLLLVGFFIILGSTAGIGPFIYTLF